MCYFILFGFWEMPILKGNLVLRYSFPTLPIFEAGTRHRMLSGKTQRYTLACHRSEEMKITHSSEPESTLQPPCCQTTTTCCQCVTVMFYMFRSRESSLNKSSICELSAPEITLVWISYKPRRDPGGGGGGGGAWTVVNCLSLESMRWHFKLWHSVKPCVFRK